MEESFNKIVEQLGSSIDESGGETNITKNVKTVDLADLFSHIFNFDEHIYGIEVEVILLHFLRDEQKFSGIEPLVAQIKSDLLAAESYFDEVY